MKNNMRGYLKCVSNVFYVIFPLIFAQCVYISTIDFKRVYDCENDKNNHNHNHHEHFLLFAKGQTDKSNSSNVIENRVFLQILNMFPLFIFKIIIVVVIVGIWKSNHFTKIFKTGIF